MYLFIYFGQFSVLIPLVFIALGLNITSRLHFNNPRTSTWISRVCGILTHNHSQCLLTGRQTTYIWTSFSLLALFNFLFLVLFLSFLSALLFSLSFTLHILSVSREKIDVLKNNNYCR